VNKIYEGAARERKIPIIFFNAELDRLRGGYYPALFYPKMAKISRELIPQMEAAFYVHNFKGQGAAALFRVYPGPWQVLVRTHDGMRVVHTQEQRLSLREVALDILPRVIRPR
jgi:hypothetical protein